MNTNGFKKDIKWGVDLNRNFPINFGSINVKLKDLNKNDEIVVFSRKGKQ